LGDQSIGRSTELSHRTSRLPRATDWLSKDSWWWHYYDKQSPGFPCGTRRHGDASIPTASDHCSCPHAGAAVYSWRRIRLGAARSGNSIAVANSTRFAGTGTHRRRMDTSDPEIRCLSGPDSVITLTLPAINRRYSRPLGSQLHRLHSYGGSCWCAKWHRRFCTGRSQDANVHRPVRTCTFRASSGPPRMRRSGSGQ
jgi:hypothetical protein